MSFGSAQPSDVTSVDVGLLEPQARGIDAVSELQRDPLDRPVLGPELRAHISLQVDRGGLLTR